jgi:hypothetical protein
MDFIIDGQNIEDSFIIKLLGELKWKRIMFL